MRHDLAVAARGFAPILAVVAVASAAIGLGIGLYRGESLVRWSAVGLDVAGALLIGVSGLLAGPEGSRRRLERRLADELPEERTQALRGEVPAIFLGGVLLILVGTLVEVIL